MRTLYVVVTVTIALLALSMQQNVEASAPVNGLITFWNMETLTGAQMQDLSLNGNHGNIDGPIDAEGKVGQSRQFDGSNDKIVNVGTFIAVGAFTAAMWIRPNSPTSSQVFACFVTATAGADRGLIIGHYSNAGNGRILATGSASRESSTNIVSATWVHVAVTKGVTGLPQIYVNGADVTVASAVFWSFGSVDRVIGSNCGGGNWYSGRVDEVRIYNRQLNATEVSDIYNDLQVYPLPPVATTVAATSIGQTSAQLNGNLDVSAATVWFEWGLTDGTPFETEHVLMTSLGDFDAAIFELTPGTTYYYRAVAEGISATDYGEMMTLVTGGSLGTPAMWIAFVLLISLMAIGFAIEQGFLLMISGITGIILGLLYVLPLSVPIGIILIGLGAVLMIIGAYATGAFEQ